MHRGQELAGILPAGPGGPLAAPLVDVAEFLQPLVALPAVGDDSRARLDVIGHERVQRDGRRIGQRPHPAPAEPRRFPDLHRDAGEHLLAPGAAAAQPRLLTADERLVHFHQLMRTFGAELVGASRVLRRTELLRQLRKYRQRAAFRGEATRLTGILVAVPREEREARLSGLPDGVSVEPGRIEVRFSGAQDAVGRLFALAQALTNDYE